MVYTKTDMENVTGGQETNVVEKEGPIVWEAQG